ncbi:DUF229 domain-containing protein [Prolixibacteraceae bacterium JC049]|nr:DUF229 domain-containing protein [Prolixibacteraceae bacterium JC049]
MICVDDLNNWISCMNGHPNAKTPHIDQLAQNGILFTNAHCQVPLCGPSRASIMSGLRPSTTGIYGQIKDDDIRKKNPATENIQFLPEYLAANGYHTMGVGKIFHHHAPKGVFHESGGRAHGFGPKPAKRMNWTSKRTKQYGGTSTDWGPFPAADSLMPDVASVRWAQERLKRTYDQPFFMAVGFLRPHVPWHVPQKWFDMHPLEQIETPPYLPSDRDDLPEIARQLDDLPMMPSTQWAIQSGKWKEIVQAYLACVSFVDHYIGELLQTLKESPYADNTIIVFWSDHGYRLGQKGTFAKHCLWKEATHTPLIFSGTPIRNNIKCDAPTELLSIYPTLLELCGLPVNTTNEGKSIAAYISNGDKRALTKSALTTYGWKNHSLRTSKYRLIHYSDGSSELYDHKKDSNEWHNIAMKKKKTVKQIQHLLPQQNALWAPTSSYRYNPFFINDKKKHSK